MIAVVFPDPAAAPTLLLVSHSMGGVDVVRACPQLLEHKFRILGVAVLDVVEGSAMEMLPHMHDLLNAHPDGFDSPEAAIEWQCSSLPSTYSSKTKMIRNANSARLSIPAIVVPATMPSPTAPHSDICRCVRQRCTGRGHSTSKLLYSYLCCHGPQIAGFLGGIVPLDGLAEMH
ncbi:hypothetical protein B0H10DRAFT_1957734 [Mycena sp. CBHHK59/15]|nr:hypothetical protein B0H10DRAFT_1957734 [Mycena sp. CBHHK59/15]